ncbi:MAG: hypothetical protein H7832_11165 [Magnetococcus sp. DMHC-6]
MIGCAGAGCIGKTTFSQQFREVIGESQCQLIGLDGYLMERKRRIQLGQISGYNPLGFELCKARKEISELILFKKTFSLPIYNRITQTRELSEQIYFKEIILIEGGLALTSHFHWLEDLHIFFNSDATTQYQLRLRREKFEFGYSEQEVKKRFDIYYHDYQKFIAPQIYSSDIILHVKTDQPLEISKNNHCISPKPLQKNCS